MTIRSCTKILRRSSPSPPRRLPLSLRQSRLSVLDRLSKASGGEGAPKIPRFRGPHLRFPLMLSRIGLFCAAVGLLSRPVHPWRSAGVRTRRHVSPRLAQNGDPGELAFTVGAGEALSRVLTGLGEDEKYNTVLAGLSTTLLAQLRSGTDRGGAESQLSELLSLLQEMQGKRIEVSDPAAGIVLDSVAASGAPIWVLQVMQALRGAGSKQASAFGAATSRLSPLPSNKSRRERALKDMPPVPDDQRAIEIGIAAAAISYAGLGVGLEGAIPFADDPSLLHTGIIPEIMLAASAVGAGVDLYGSGGSTLLKIRSGLSRLFYQVRTRGSRTNMEDCHQ
eukprot:scaffold343_cov245-Pinguiococcus_pyrenoidosus.AAC.16